MIYIIHEEENDNFKIGYTKNNPLSRLQSCKTHCPYPVSLLGTFPGDTQKEKELHQRFFSNRTRYNGEWFHTDKQEMIDLIMKEGGKLYEETLFKKTEKSSLELVKKLFLKCEEQEKQILNLERRIAELIANSEKKDIKLKFDSGVLAAIYKECSASFAVYWLLSTNADNHREVSIGTRYIAQQCGCCMVSVHNAVKSLIKHNLIEVKNKNTGQRTVYKILL